MLWDKKAIDHPKIDSLAFLQNPGKCWLQQNRRLSEATFDNHQTSNHPAEYIHSIDEHRITLTQ